MDASEFGWSPGHWPETFQHLNGRRYYRREPIYGLDGVFEGYVYRTEDGADRLCIYND